MVKIDTLIFDLGGVLYDIDVNLTVRAFIELGVTDMPAFHQSLLEGRVYENLDTGFSNPADFREQVRKLSGVMLSDVQVDHAWNSLLVSFPRHRVELLQGLRNNYRILLLSNTNAIHYDYYSALFKQDYGFDFDSLFDEAYFSYRLGMRKPDLTIFRYMIENSSLVPEQSVFIDDLSLNTDAARSTGLKAIHLDGYGDVTELFDNLRLKEILL